MCHNYMWQGLVARKIRILAADIGSGLVYSLGVEVAWVDAHAFLSKIHRSQKGCFIKRALKIRAIEHFSPKK